MRKALWAGWSEALRRALMTAAASRVRWVGPWVAQSAPVSAARSAQSTVFSAFPARVAAATTTVTATGAATGTDLSKSFRGDAQASNYDVQLHIGESRD